MEKLKDSRAATSKSPLPQTTIVITDDDLPSKEKLGDHSVSLAERGANPEIQPPSESQTTSTASASTEAPHTALLNPLIPSEQCEKMPTHLLSPTSNAATEMDSTVERTSDIAPAPSTGSPAQSAPGPQIPTKLAPVGEFATSGDKNDKDDDEEEEELMQSTPTCGEPLDPGASDADVWTEHPGPNGLKYYYNRETKVSCRLF